jgi:DNA mismatch repair protein MutS
LRVAIAEQLEDPKQTAAAKTIVRRDVVRVMTAGTLQEDALLPARRCNYLCAVFVTPQGAGLAAIECSTGEFLATEIGASAPPTALWDEITRLAPSEVIVEVSDHSAPLKERLEKNGFPVAQLPSVDFAAAMAEERLKKTLGVASLRGFGLEGKPWALSAAGAALRYLDATQCGRPTTIQPLHTYRLEDTLQLDAATLDHLDLVGSASAASSSPRTLLDILDQTLTCMGGRLLRRWLVAPLRKVETIRERQAFVEFFSEGKEGRRQLRAPLQGCPDFERILARLTAGALAPRDLTGLGQGLKRVGRVRSQLAQAHEQATALGAELHPALARFLTHFPEDRALSELLAHALVEAPPTTLKDGGLVREGYNRELDEIRSWIQNGKTRLLELEKSEREKTGIGSLKVGFNNIFGYFIEVTKTHLSRVPEHYIRKQTTANGERYVTPELKEFETQILGAEERTLRVETALVQELREKILARAALLRQIAQAVSELDVYLSLAEAADRYRYVKPLVEDSDALVIRAGWHAVLDAVLPPGTLVANDVDLNGSDKKIVILTGPNMSGKSTYLRQTALIVIMAQVGSFVPAAEARVGVVDHLFTRIGASDRLADGESTFMVEMVETARILNHATPRSLVILDEVGRGTSTYDGISIAWACLEHLARISPKVLFATHYFELTQIAQQLPGVRNAHVTAKEWEDEVIFLHKVEDGPADRAYGIHVARLAGVPKEVVQRAAALLKKFEARTPAERALAENQQTLLFDAPAKRDGENDRLLAEALQRIELNQMTPLQAMLMLHEWKERFTRNKERGT